MSSLFQYRPFFSVQLLIDYYLTEEGELFQDTIDNPMADVLEQQVRKYNLQKEFQIVPTNASKKIMKDKRLLLKKDHRGFFVSGQVTELEDGSFIPYVSMDEAFSLQFAVYLQNAYFYNFTNIRLERGQTEGNESLYYFSNRAGNVVDNELLYISSPVPDFDPNYSYEASEIFIDNSNPLSPVMWEAIENNGPGAFNAANWRTLFNGVDPLFQFATNSDRVVLKPSIFKVNVEEVGEELLIFLLWDVNNNLAKVVNFMSSESGTPLVECELDFRDLHSGYYVLEVQNDIGALLPALGLTIFMSDNLVHTRPFALIECVHQPDGSLDDYRWFDQDNENRLLFPNYMIRWKNRSTWWRYYHDSSPNVTSAVLENLDPDVNAPNNRILISTSPLALTQLGREITVTLGNGDQRLMPNPGIALIYPENGRIYSELNMGGGFGPPD